MGPLILGLHGSVGDVPATGVHDAAFCLADLETRRVTALVEQEKLSGVRHDGRLPAARIEAELQCHPGRAVELASTHFTTFGDTRERSFPLLGDLDALDPRNLGACLRERADRFGASRPHSVYLHELAHVFSAFMFRERDHERFLGWVIEGCGSFSQNALFLVDGFRIELLSHDDPLLSGLFFHQFLARRVFDIDRADHAGRSATAGKVMALAAYGDPDRFRAPLEEAVRAHRPGRYMDYRDGFCPALEGQTPSWRDRVDLCAAGQALFEELIVERARQIRDRHGDLPLYYAGGCALSIKANAQLRRVFGELVIPPDCGDDGIALGLAGLHAFVEHRTRLEPLEQGLGLFSAVGDGVDAGSGLSDPDVHRVAGWLARGEIVAFVQGTPEIGPRALGHRSILASPAAAGTRDVLNHIKGREYFRPVAPVVLDPAGPELFEEYAPSPSMLYEYRIRPGRAASIPAALHVDGTARVQSVADGCSDLARLLRAFAHRTGRPPVLLNTSLNSRGRPLAAGRDQVMAELARLKIGHLVTGGRTVTL